MKNTRGRFVRMELIIPTRDDEPAMCTFTKKVAIEAGSFETLKKLYQEKKEDEARISEANNPKTRRHNIEVVERNKMREILNTSDEKQYKEQVYKISSRLLEISDENEFYRDSPSDRERQEVYLFEEWDQIMTVLESCTNYHPIMKTWNF